jgi:two-component system nitrogen regulation sensor histidine kinase GlnL
MEIEEDYDPSLPPTWAIPTSLLQVFLNLSEERRRGRRRGGRHDPLRTPSTSMSLRVRRKDGTGGRVPLQVEIIDDGPGLPPEIAGTSSSPSSRAARTAPGWASRWSPRSFPTTTAGSRWTVPGRTVFRISLPARRARSRMTANGA